MWIDQLNGGMVMLGFTRGGAAAAEALRGSYPHPDSVQYFDATYSTAELNGVIANINHRLVAGSFNGIPIPMMSVRNDMNRVLVFTRSSHLAAAQEAMQQEFGDAVRVEVFDGEVGDTGCSRTVCDPPLRGGLRIRNASSGRRCTSGFIATNGSSNYVLTAGHCVNAGQNMTHTRISPTTGAAIQEVIGGVPNGGSVQSNTVDAARVLMNANGYFATPSRWVYLTSGAQAYQIRARAALGDYQPGMVACQSSVITGYDCYFIASINASGGGQSNQIELSGCARRGDSGGPIFDDGRWDHYGNPRVGGYDGMIAIGLLQAGTNPDTGVSTCDDPRYDNVSWSTPIRTVESALSITVRTS